MSTPVLIDNSLINSAVTATIVVSPFIYENTPDSPSVRDIYFTGTEPGRFSHIILHSRERLRLVSPPQENVPENVMLLSEERLPIFFQSLRSLGLAFKYPCDYGLRMTFHDGSLMRLLQSICLERGHMSMPESMNPQQLLDPPYKYIREGLDDRMMQYIASGAFDEWRNMLRSEEGIISFQELQAISTTGALLSSEGNDTSHLSIYLNGLYKIFSAITGLKSVTGIPPEGDASQDVETA